MLKRWKKERKVDNGDEMKKKKETILWKEKKRKNII